MAGQDGAGRTEPPTQPPLTFAQPTAAWNTVLAAGAAVSPPAPWPTSSTATATRGCLYGAKPTNQASVSVLSSGCGVGLAPASTGCGSSLTVLRSSAVPVLPATLTPGTAAPTPVPPVTTARMKRAITAAVRVLAARVSLPWAPRESTGATRRPRRPMVAATVASSSGVASTLPWPIADEPTARSSPISSGAGIVERAAPTGPGFWLKPKRSAVSTRRRAPTFAPSGANTELQESANELLSEPPHASPWAFWSFTPSSVVSVWTGKLEPALTLRASSAAASVMILNVEPGGWGAENAMPERPRTSP